MIPLTSGHRLETANQEIRRAVFEMEGDDKPTHHLSALVQTVCNNFL